MLFSLLFIIVNWLLSSIQWVLLLCSMSVTFSGWGQSSQLDKHMQSGNHGNHGYHAQRNLIHYRFLSRSCKSHVEIKDDSIANFMFTVPYCRMINNGQSLNGSQALPALTLAGRALVSCPDPTLSRGKGPGDHWAIPWLCQVSSLDTEQPNEIAPCHATMCSTDRPIL